MKKMLVDDDASTSMVTEKMTDLIGAGQYAKYLYHQYYYKLQQLQRWNAPD